VPAGKSIYVYQASAGGGKLVNEGLIAAAYGKLATTEGLVNHGELVLIDTTVDGPVQSPAGHHVNVIGTVEFNGPVSGGGGFFGSGTAVFNDEHHPGDSTAVVTSECNLTYGPDAALTIELGGTADYDRLLTSRDLTLDGTLNVVLVNGFMPRPGDAFDVLDWAALSGEFGTINLPDPANPHESWDTGKLYVDGTIGVVPAPSAMSTALVLLAPLVLRRRRARPSRP